VLWSLTLGTLAQPFVQRTLPSSVTLIYLCSLPLTVFSHLCSSPSTLTALTSTLTVNAHRPLCSLSNRHRSHPTTAQPCNTFVVLIYLRQHHLPLFSSSLLLLPLIINTASAPTCCWSSVICTLCLPQCNLFVQHHHRVCVSV
jgi:hypothetical protein